VIAMPAPSPASGGPVAAFGLRRDPPPLTMPGDLGKREIAAAGGADRWSAKNAARPRINRAKRTTRRDRTTPQGEASPKACQREFRYSGCRRLVHVNMLALLDDPSPGQTEPEVGFEPTTFRLRVGP
jgi:hypothetical protein